MKTTILLLFLCVNAISQPFSLDCKVFDSDIIFNLEKPEKYCPISFDFNSDGKKDWVTFRPQLGVDLIRYNDYPILSASIFNSKNINSELHFLVVDIFEDGFFELLVYQFNNALFGLRDDLYIFAYSKEEKTLVLKQKIELGSGVLPDEILTKQLVVLDSYGSQGLIAEYPMRLEKPIGYYPLLEYSPIIEETVIIED